VRIFPFLRLLAASALSLQLTTGALSARTGFALDSPTFHDGGVLPRESATERCGGRNRFPGLSWRGAPAGTRSYAVIVFDRDAREGRGVVHWVAYGYPGSTTELPPSADPPAGPISGVGTRGAARYAGPCPPAGELPHRYLYTVYALDLEPTAFPAGYTRDRLLAAMSGHIVGRARIVGRYGRRS